MVSKRQLDDREINIEDRVKITLPNGWWAEGTVTSARNYGEGDGWYIELEIDKAIDGHRGYGQWKQGCDGGTVEKLS